MRKWMVEWRERANQTKKKNETMEQKRLMLIVFIFLFSFLPVKLKRNEKRMIEQQYNEKRERGGSWVVIVQVKNEIKSSCLSGRAEGGERRHKRALTK